MIRDCSAADFETVLSIINDGAEAYRGVIPADRWKTPYMSSDELRHEMDQGVAFIGHEAGGFLTGVMGAQPVKDVQLIRHAYVRTAFQGRGMGGALLQGLTKNAPRPFLVGTWADAKWAIRFYEKHGFRLVDETEKDRLLRVYWSVPDRQIETSVVLADSRWPKRSPLAGSNDAEAS